MGDYSGKRPTPELGLCYWASVVCDVVLLHEPGTGAVGHLEELEGDQGLQERCLPSAQGVGREGGQVAPPCTRRQPYRALEGAGRLHWCADHWTFQGQSLPLLNAI